MLAFEKVVTNLSASSSGYTLTTRIRRKLSVKCFKASLKNGKLLIPKSFGYIDIFKVMFYLSFLNY